MIEISIPNRVLQIVGIKGKKCSKEEVEKVFEERRKNWKPRKSKYESGILKIFSEHAVSPMKGGYMK